MIRSETEVKKEFIKGNTTLYDIYILGRTDMLTDVQQKICEGKQK